MEVVQKGYIIEINPFYRGLIRKIIANEFLVFIPTSGWHGRKWVEENYKLILFHKMIPHHDWWEGWWTSNWKMEDWSWCYEQLQPKFIASTITDGWVSAI